MHPITSIEGAILMAGAATMLGVPPQDRADIRHRNVPLRGLGVRTADDRVAEHGVVHYRHREINPISILDLDRAPAEMPIEAIFGGVVGPHFGHVITQSIGRLWMSETLPSELPILFVGANTKMDRIPEYFAEILGILGIGNPLVLVTEPTRVGKLYMGPELCNLERRPPADPFFLDWLQRHRPEPQVDPGLSLYISRSRIGPGPGQFLQETILEAAFEAEGYRIVHPETLDIPGQIELYRTAKRLVFADGSAVHLWSFFASAEQLAAIVQRRQWLRTLKTLGRWFRSFRFAKVRTLDHVIANYSGPRIIGRQPAALLNLQSLWHDLGVAGFHSGTRQVGVAEDALRRWREQGGDPPFARDQLSAELLASRPNLSWIGTDGAAGAV